MALDALYMLRHLQSQFGQEIENVYFYNHVAGSGSSVDLALAWQANILELVQAMQVPGVLSNGLIVTNMGDLGDFTTLPLASSGSYSEVNPLPAFNAISFTMKLNTRAVRPGSKRITGIAEAATAGNEIVVAELLDAMEAFRISLQTNLVSGGDTWENVVVKRVKTAIPDTTPVQYRYRLPTIGETPVVGTVVAALDNKIVSSQVSRK